jgi:hypothetical protein
MFYCTRKWYVSLSDNPTAENVEHDNNYQTLLVNKSPIKMWYFWILVLHCQNNFNTDGAVTGISHKAEAKEKQILIHRSENCFGHVCKVTK